MIACRLRDRIIARGGNSPPNGRQIDLRRVESYNGLLRGQEYIDRSDTIEPGNSPLDVLCAFRTVHSLDRDFNCFLKSHVYDLKRSVFLILIGQF